MILFRRGHETCHLTPIHFRAKMHNFAAAAKLCPAITIKENPLKKYIKDFEL